MEQRYDAAKVNDLLKGRLLLPRDASRLVIGIVWDPSLDDGVKQSLRAHCFAILQQLIDAAPLHDGHPSPQNGQMFWNKLERIVSRQAIDNTGLSWGWATHYYRKALELGYSRINGEAHASPIGVHDMVGDYYGLAWELLATMARHLVDAKDHGHLLPFVRRLWDKHTIYATDIVPSTNSVHEDKLIIMEKHRHGLWSGAHTCIEALTGVNSDNPPDDTIEAIRALLGELESEDNKATLNTFKHGRQFRSDTGIVHYFKADGTCVAEDSNNNTNTCTENHCGKAERTEYAHTGYTRKSVIPGSKKHIPRDTAKGEGGPAYVMAVKRHDKKGDSLQAVYAPCDCERCEVDWGARTEMIYRDWGDSSLTTTVKGFLSGNDTQPRR
jgi:hypothetical protein